MAPPMMVAVRRHGVPAVFAALTAATLLSGVLDASAAGTSIPHGGAGIVSPLGLVGSLQIDRSTIGDITAVAGEADFEGHGSYFQGPNPPGIADFIALGYDCSRTRRPDRGDATGPYTPSQVYCETTYLINQRTLTLAGFWTSSKAFVTPGGTRPGMTQSQANLREHGSVYVNGFGIYERGRTATLVVGNRGGRNIGEGKGAYILGGKVDELALESRNHQVGLLFT